MNDKLERKIYNILRKISIKYITGNLGKIVESDDRITCYINHYNESSKVIRLYNSSSEENMKLTKSYNINKPIYYVIDGINFENYASITMAGYDNVNVIIRNCKFKYFPFICIRGTCRIESCDFDCYPSLDIIADDLSIIDSKINSYRNTRIGSKRNLCISNSSIFCNSKNNMNMSSINGTIYLDNAIIDAGRLYIESPSILSNNSLISAVSEIKIKNDTFNSLNVNSPNIFYNDDKIGTGNVIIRSDDLPLINSRMELINVLKKVNYKCENKINEEINRLRNNPIKKLKR